MNFTVADKNIYSLNEVADALHMSTETIRRKIVSGELKAVEVGGAKRKQYRILAKDLVTWLGEDNANEIFGFTKGLEALRELFGSLSSSERSKLITEANEWARAQIVESELQGNSLTKDEIASRFK